MKKYFLFLIFIVFQFCSLSAQVNTILRLQAANGANTDETVIYFNPGASNGLDGYDSQKMWVLQAGMPQIYTTIGTDSLVINGFNNVASLPIIPLGFRTSTSTTYTITATQIANFSADQPILILDTVLKVVQDLRANPVYTFSSGATNSMGRFLIIFSNTWTGSSSSDWSDAANWSTLAVPTNVDNVYLPSYGLNQPHVTSVSTIPASCSSLNIQKGAVLTVDAGKALSASGKTTNNGAFIIKSDASAIGSFIDNGQIEGTGTFTVEKYLYGAGAGIPNGRYYYQSSPLSNAKSSVFDAFGPNKLWYYNEPTGGYTEITDNTTDLDLLTGYVVRTGANATYNYTGGMFNSGNFSNTNLTRTGTTAVKRGFALIGNPYPSHIDWSMASTVNLQNTIWFRTENLSNTMVFDTYNSFGIGTNNNGNGTVTNFIAPTQAFWVRVDADGNTGQVSFDNSIRCHQSSNTLKKEKLLNTVLRMVVADGSNTDETVIYFNSSASNSYDAYDSQKMFSLAVGMPQIYTSIGTDTLVINGLASVASNPEVPVGFRTLSTGTFSLTATEMSNFDPLQTIYLQDNLLSVIQDLRANPVYSFTSGVVNTASRFKIVFDLTTSASEMANIPVINVFNNNSKINVVLSGYDEVNGNVVVTNLLGQEMISEKLLEKTTEINTSLPKGIYIVKVQTSIQKHTKKIVVQ